MPTVVNDALRIYESAVRAVQPRGLLDGFDWELHLGRPLTSFAHIRIAGTGKASMAMAGALEAALGAALDEGFVTVPHGYSSTFPDHLLRPKQLSVLEAGHPVPDSAGVVAAERALALARASGGNDLLLVPISGGGSALWPCLCAGISLADGQETARLLLNCGADIHEINTVRKHLSRIKGGRLAQAAYPGHVLALLISDVVGDDVDVIASGPTVPDPTTFSNAVSICDRFDLLQQLPASVRTHLERGLVEPALETPKPGTPLFDHVRTVLLGTNRIALDAAGNAAEKLGYGTRIVTDQQTGEARDVARIQIASALEAREAHDVCLLWGGETTVTVTGDGKGGRNQEAALAALIGLDGCDADIVFLSGGTDGIDGPTDAAGAWSTAESAALARSMGLMPETFLERNDAYAFFQQMDQLLRPGPTHTNVMDIQVILIRRRHS